MGQPRRIARRLSSRLISTVPLYSICDPMLWTMRRFPWWTARMMGHLQLRFHSAWKREVSVLIRSYALCVSTPFLLLPSSIHLLTKCSLPSLRAVFLPRLQSYYFVCVFPIISPSLYRFKHAQVCLDFECKGWLQTFLEVVCRYLIDRRLWTGCQNKNLYFSTVGTKGYRSSSSFTLYPPTVSFVISIFLSIALLGHSHSLIFSKKIAAVTRSLVHLFAVPGSTHIEENNLWANIW